MLGKTMLSETFLRNYYYDGTDHVADWPERRVEALGKVMTKREPPESGEVTWMVPP